jgi:uncharacterized protein
VGISPSALRPIDRISQVRCPVFVISGAEDQHTTPAQIRALFAKAPDPKRLWLVPGAAHVDLDRFAGAEYERRVLGFLSDSFTQKGPSLPAVGQP